MTTIRFVRPSDAQRILEIYRPYVTDTAITFETEVPSMTAFSQRIQDISAEYPYLVAEEDGRIVGYAYAHRYQERSAYQWNAELSVYVDRCVIGRGIGSRLYEALIDLCKKMGLCNLYGIVTIPNMPSERLHEKKGFVRIGTYHKTGYKHGAWRDVAIFEKRLTDEEMEPGELLEMDVLKKTLSVAEY